MAGVTKEDDPSGGSGLVSGLQPEIRDLVERLASGSAFGKSNRLRALFLFLCDRKATDPEGVIREQEIGIAIFNRRPDYDTAEDPIVRVHVSQLRKRLEQYFASEGRDEPIVIEIPKGSYAPVFRSRDSYSSLGRLPELFRSYLPSRGKRRIAALLVLAVGGVLLVAGLLFGLWNLVSSTRPARNLEVSATVDRLWVQMFDNGHPTCIVLSDVVLGLFEDAIQYQLTLNEYRDKDFSRLSSERLKDPADVARWKQLIGEYFTHISDARSAATFSVLNAGRNLPTEIVFAGDFGVNYLQSHNLILVGTRRTNPWVDIFENQLNFQTVFREGPPMSCHFQNRSPLPGESAEYEVKWTKQGFCRVAFLPSPSRRGNVLLISGTDMASSEAGGQFISGERWVQTLRSALALSEKAPFPYFEVLLKIDYMIRGTPKFELVAHRIYKF
ncbi:MAG TPA: hypothetical protein VMW38_00330 [Terriglobia bacterium]|nr:hypothetical protein [Terriglobia bacterium]